MTSYQNIRKTTCWIYKVLFSVCSDNIALKCYEKTKKTTHWIWNVLFSSCFGNMSAWHVIRTQGSNSLKLESVVFFFLITFLHDMLSERKENTTFQTQRVRNHLNHYYVYPPATSFNLQPTFPTSPKTIIKHQQNNNSTNINKTKKQLRKSKVASVLCFVLGEGRKGLPKVWGGSSEVQNQ